MYWEYIKFNKFVNIENWVDWWKLVWLRLGFIVFIVGGF